SDFGLRREAKRRAALGCAERGVIAAFSNPALRASQSGVVAALCHRSPNARLDSRARMKTFHETFRAPHALVHRDCCESRSKACYDNERGFSGNSEARTAVAAGFHSRRRLRAV